MKTVLFDLDGTLLPMDQDKFIEAYMGTMAKKLTPHGYAPEVLAKGLFAGIKAMVTNDGTITNEKAFWNTFVGIVGEQVLQDMPVFDDYYRNEFQSVAEVCGYDARAKEIIDYIREKGHRVVLATNPLFPAVATESRMRWAGLEKDEFALYTTYENSSFCKPNPKYYLEILEKIGVVPEECLMVGNDVTEDMVAETLGMKVFLLTDCVINEENKEISGYPQGSFPELLAYLEENL